MLSVLWHSSTVVFIPIEFGAPPTTLKSSINIGFYCVTVVLAYTWLTRKGRLDLL